MHILFILGSSPGEDSLLVYALVEFVEEECTAVVPLQRICNHENVQAGDRVKVLWDNRKEYTAIFLLSGIRSLNTRACNAFTSLSLDIEPKRNVE